jgi:alpha-tubulin suppressor-like RCC1 family protein
MHVQQPVLVGNRLMTIRLAGGRINSSRSLESTERGRAEEEPVRHWISKRLRQAALPLVFAVGVGGPWVMGAGIASASSAIAVSAGGDYTCVVLSGAGSVECWGDNGYGQLGIGRATKSFTPVPVSGIDAAAVSAGEVHTTCAVLSRGGGVRCWGASQFGRNGVYSVSIKPVAVSGLSHTVAISVGARHTCAVLFSGRVKCWGENFEGELGNGTTSGSLTPVAVSGLSNAVAVSAAEFHTCALLSDASVECWGNNVYGQLGNGTTDSSLTPVAVSGLSNAVAVSTSRYYTCALLSSGGVECWGDNGHGQLGNGTANYNETTDSSLTPVAVSGLSNAVAVSTGTEHTCAVLSTGGVECWGDNVAGQLGNGTTTRGLTPVPVSGIDAVAVSAGDQHTCAVLSDGDVKCWGGNLSGQLGNGTTDSSLRPVSVRFPVSEPVFGRTANLRPVAGTVLIKRPGGNFAPLNSAETVPLRTTVDTARGTVRLTTARRAHGSAAGAHSATETGLFHGAAFRVAQKVARSRLRGGRTTGLTVLTLAGQLPSDCGPKKAGRGVAAAAQRGHSKGRHLWGDAHGNFSTGGRYASATVRGTKWLTEDTCAGTLVKVARGVVSVRDIPHHRTVLVRAPHSFLAQPGGAR